jgi:AmpD protein
MTPPLQLHAATGLIAGARQVLSPHHDARPDGQLPELVVIHGISLPPGRYGGPEVEQLFTGNLPPQAHPYFAAIAGLRVSAHLFIRRDGELVQCVPLGRRAWHAGVSSFAGRPACNDFSIGIELEGSDDTSYAPAQYQSLAQVLRLLRAQWPVLQDGRIVGHSDVAPGRKTDPGPAFDWDLLRRLLAAA